MVGAALTYWSNLSRYNTVVFPAVSNQTIAQWYVVNPGILSVNCDNCSLPMIWPMTFWISRQSSSFEHDVPTFGWQLSSFFNVFLHLSFTIFFPNGRTRSQCQRLNPLLNEPRIYWCRTALMTSILILPPGGVRGWTTLTF